MCNTSVTAEIDMHAWVCGCVCVGGVTSQKVKNYCSEGTRTLWATKAPLTYNCWMERRARRTALLQIHQSCQGPARHQHKFISTGVTGKTQQLHIYWMTIPVRFTLKCRENIDKVSHNDTSSAQIAGTDINNFNNSWKIQNWNSYEGLLSVIYYSSTVHQLTSSVH